MTNPQNPAQFGADAAVDTAADSVINDVLHVVESHLPVPGGQAVDQMIQTEVDQVANNAVNAEVNKGVGGIIGDIEGMLGGHH